MPQRHHGLRRLLGAAALAAACSSASTPPPPSASLSPSDGILFNVVDRMANARGEPLVIQFDRSMARTSVVLAGTLTSNTYASAWSTRVESDDTLTLRPASAGGQWTEGLGFTLHVAGHALAGGDLSADFTLNVGALTPRIQIEPYPYAASDQPIVVSLDFHPDPASLVLGGVLAESAHEVTWAVDHSSFTLRPTTYWATALGQSLSVLVYGSHSTAVLGEGLFFFNVSGLIPTGELSPASGPLQPTQAITVLFSESMYRSSLYLGGTLSPGVFRTTWSATTVFDDTVTITPSLFWPAGAQRLTIDGSSFDGHPLTQLNASYDVALDAACGAAGGACVNATDCAHPVSQLSSWTQTCYVASAGSEAPTETCIQGGGGSPGTPGTITPGCSVCSYQYATCALTNCFDDCRVELGMFNCRLCVAAAGCTTSFSACAGRTF